MTTLSAHRANVGSRCGGTRVPMELLAPGDITRGRRDVTAGFVGFSSQRRPPRARHDDDAVDRIFKAASSSVKETSHELH
jgi:hypothetical protein